MSITIPLNIEDTRRVSDGYHTFEELYQHRILLYLNLTLLALRLSPTWDARWKPHYPGWPVLFLKTPAGQISYHFEEKYLPFIEDRIERDDNYQWDGHTSDDVLARLMELLK